MSFITKNYLSHYFFFSFIIFSCSSSSISIAVLTYSPGLAQKTFQANTKKLENKALKKPNDPHTLFKASKNLTMLTYGFIISSVICSFFNIDSLLIKVFIIQYSMPSAVFNFILADKYNKNPDRVASIVFVSTLLSLFTIPVILYFLMK